MNAVTRRFLFGTVALAAASLARIAKAADAKLSALATGTVPTYYYGEEGGVSKRYNDSKIFNVLNYGADPTGVADSTTAIRAALTAMYANVGGSGIVFFPPGAYKVTDTIDISTLTGSFTSGSIRGSGRWASAIFGTVNTGFILAQNNQTNGLGEISSINVTNYSTYLGTGALRVSTSSMAVSNCHFQGMINVLLPYNIYNMSIDDCTGEANLDATTGYNGTLGIAGFSPLIRGWRSTNQFMTCLQLYGSNETTVDGCGIENCVIAVSLGFQTAWANACTVAPDGSNPGFSILTVGGLLGNTETPMFNIGGELFMRGLTLPAFGALPSTNGSPTDATTIAITANHNTDATLTGVGFGGTYRINGTFTISTPVPLWARVSASIGSFSLNAIGTEANYCILFINNAGAGTVHGVGGGATPNQCGDAFGNLGYTANCGFYIFQAGNIHFAGCSPVNNGYRGSFVFDPNATLTGAVFEGCIAQKSADNVSTATISDGMGGSGNILNVTATATIHSFIGIGMHVSGNGVTPGGVITGNNASNPALTGAGGTGTYTVTNAQNLSARTVTISTGSDWIMPTNTQSKAGVKFPNCGSLLPAPISFTASISTTTMTVSAASDILSNGLTITSGAAVGTTIVSQLTGTAGGAGTYQVSISQSVSSTSMVARIRSGLNDLNMTFTCLPEQAGATANIALVKGDEWFITDIAKSGGGTAAIGDAVQGGGTQSGDVGWNGTSWIFKG